MTRIKPLDWNTGSYDRSDEYERHEGWHAPCINGYYRIFSSFNTYLDSHTGQRRKTIIHAKSEAEAKAAAQEDWEQTLEPWLSSD